jgi:hypothetical protein
MIAPNYATFRALFANTATRANDGMLEWDGWTIAMSTGITAYTVTFPISIDLAGSDDAAAFVDEWHWYLSVSNEGSGYERIQLVRYDPSDIVSRSGRVQIRLTAAGTAELQTHDTTWMDRFFRDSYLYAKKISDGEVYYADLHRLMFAKY